MWWLSYHDWRCCRSCRMSTAGGWNQVSSCSPPAVAGVSVIPNGVVVVPAGLGAVLPRVETTMVSASYFFRCFGCAAFRAVRFSLQCLEANVATLSWLCCERACVCTGSLSAAAVLPVEESGRGTGVGVLSVLMVITLSPKIVARSQARNQVSRVVVGDLRLWHSVVLYVPCT
jgi:hypothetical protein